MDYKEDALDIYGDSDYEIAARLGRRSRDYGIALRLTQKRYIRKTGISAVDKFSFMGNRVVGCNDSHITNEIECYSV